jgi:hypothetical protein
MATIWFHDRSEKAYLRKKTKVHKLTKIHYDKLPPEKDLGNSPLNDTLTTDRFIKK